MAKIIRGAGNIRAFASGASVGSRTVFGGTMSSDTLTDNATVDFLKGWEIVGPNDFPTLEDFNAMGYTLGQYIAYLHQQGVAEWDAGQEYHVGSVVASSGNLYICKTNSFTSASAPAIDPSNWSKVLSDNDFNDIITASEVIDNLTSTDATKPLSASQGKVLSDTTIKLTGNQTVAGVKTFSSAPKSSVASSASDDLVRRDQVISSDYNVYNVTSSRIMNTWYENTTSAPMFVYASGGYDKGTTINIRKGSSGSAQFTSWMCVNIAGYPILHTHSVVVPPGYHYQIIGAGGLTSLPSVICEVRI